MEDARSLLAGIKARGVSVISGDYVIRGVEAVAAPVFNFKNEITLVIVLVGVEGSMDMRDEGPTLTELRQAAKALSARLGAPSESAG